MIRRELNLLCLQRGTLLGAFSFFALALFCVSLGLGPDEKILKRSAPVLLWILAILTTLFSTPHLLKTEAQEGLLDEIILQPSPPAFYLLSKLGAEWLLVGLPLSVIAIFLSPWFALSLGESLILSTTLLIGFPALSSLGILGGLLTLNARGGEVLLSLLILPLTLPLLLFGLSVMETVQLGLDSFPSFCLLTSMSLLLVILAVGAGSWAIRFAIEGDI